MSKITIVGPEPDNKSKTSSGYSKNIEAILLKAKYNKEFFNKMIEDRKKALNDLDIKLSIKEKFLLEKISNEQFELTIKNFEIKGITKKSLKQWTKTASIILLLTTFMIFNQGCMGIEPDPLSAGSTPDDYYFKLYNDGYQKIYLYDNQIELSKNFIFKKSSEKIDYELSPNDNQISLNLRNLTDELFYLESKDSFEMDYDLFNSGINFYSPDEEKLKSSEITYGIAFFNDSIEIKTEYSVKDDTIKLYSSEEGLLNTIEINQNVDYKFILNNITLGYNKNKKEIVIKSNGIEEIAPINHFPSNFKIKYFVKIGKCSDLSLLLHYFDLFYFTNGKKEN